uniref:Odorranain-E1 antimicrobial peptide n=1 Tax=Odorrana grahami TaxID=167935 RepID=A6MBK8_ODOGR|nr:odorranain-E1 antimicrobial peptide precursor [Odorrana grahami]
MDEEAEERTINNLFSRGGGRINAAGGTAGLTTGQPAVTAPQIMGGSLLRRPRRLSSLFLLVVCWEELWADNFFPQATIITIIKKSRVAPGDPVETTNIFSKKKFLFLLFFGGIFSFFFEEEEKDDEEEGGETAEEEKKRGLGGAKKNFIIAANKTAPQSVKKTFSCKLYNG